MTGWMGELSWGFMIDQGRNRDTEVGGLWRQSTFCGCQQRRYVQRDAMVSVFFSRMS